MPWIVRWPRIDLDRIDDERFASAVDRFQLQMKALQPDHETATAFQFASSFVEIAKNHWDASQHEAAWTAYKGAERCLVELLDEDGLLLEQQQVLLESREKLSGWRKATVEQLLASSSDEPTPMNDLSRRAFVRRLQFARRVLDEQTDNTYLRTHVLRGHLRRAGVVLVVVMLLMWAAIAMAQATGWTPDRVQDPFTDPWQFAVLAGLGAFGAAVSGVVRFMTADTEWRIPQLKAERVLIWLRPVVGAAAALVVIGVLESGLGGLQLDAQAVLAIAVVSGFTETLVSRAVTQASTAIAK